jgi:hypothetical protein
MDIMYFILYALTILCWFVQYPCIYIFNSFVFGKSFTDEDGLSKPKDVVKERVQ